MSRPDSRAKPRSLAKEAQSRFFALDHVGAVKHFEGVDMEEISLAIREILASEDSKFEDSKETMQGTLVYTNVAEIKTDGSTLALWVTVNEAPGVGSIMDAKLHHKVEQSAEADERLARFLEKIDLALN